MPEFKTQLKFYLAVLIAFLPGGGIAILAYLLWARWKKEKPKSVPPPRGPAARRR